MKAYAVSMDVVDDEGIHPYLIEVTADSAFEAESEAHLIATYGDCLTVLQVVRVEEIQPA